MKKNTKEQYVVLFQIYFELIVYNVWPMDKSLHVLPQKHKTIYERCFHILRFAPSCLCSASAATSCPTQMCV